ncbi:hypothetical protein A0H81_08329 [Grifola frondosa]|uniref:Transcription factor CBF/NF-Y/archaeal histone domain-containing protein n=1 Tax=Grifola frondosa TaxID=5627 RepID=A0A1C7M416_GRIFR|nr:hypothetical protein A0H81_08329 [Grifola frondosa]
MDPGPRCCYLNEQNRRQGHERVLPTLLSATGDRTVHLLTFSSFETFRTHSRTRCLTQIMAQPFTSISANDGQSLSHDTPDIDTENEDEEFDQLDSDLNEENEGQSASSSRSRQHKYGVREPGHTLIPAPRLENILYADGSGGHMSKEAVFMLSIATEEFVRRLTEAGHRRADEDKRSVINYRDVAAVPQQQPQFAFLQDTIPPPISLSEALERRAAKERALLEDDPATSAAVTPSALATGVPLPTQTSRLKGKSRQSGCAQPNGNEKTNGSTSANTGAGTKRQRDSKGRWSHSGEQTPEGGDAGTSASVGTRTASTRTRTRTARAGPAPVPAAPATNGMHALPHGRPGEQPPWAALPPGYGVRAPLARVD